VNRPPVLCIGVLVADIFVPPLQRLPAAGELVATDDFLIQPGGCAANVALALGTLVTSAAVCGRVGEDMLGEFVVRALESHGIDITSVRATRGFGTSKTVILPVVDEDRRYLHTFGANAALKASDIDDAALDAAEVVYVGGYLMLPALREDELAARLTRARARGATVILDVALPAGSETSLRDMSGLLALADYFVPNIDEARTLTGEADPRRQTECLIQNGAQRVLIKLGDRGAYVRSSEREFEIAAPQVKAIDPSGAGDAFAAGLIVGIREGWDLERTVRFANVTGSSACTALGSWGGVFTREQAEAVLASQPLQARTATPA
jgi:sugar/nucleoside kinase (ribokinase family)